MFKHKYLHVAVGLICFFSILPQTTLAQEQLNIGEKITLKSQVLNATRTLYISLPKSYNDTTYSPKAYPVLYFFDGDSHFENLVAQRNWQTRNLYATMPEVILVGIVQEDRTHELTPTKMETPASWKRANFSTSGGNPTFMTFIETEVKPLINNTYRTNGFEILSGHSFGGLATVNCFVNTPQFFDAYVAIDPSMWWNHTNILNHMQDQWITEAHQGKLLFVAKANDPGSGAEHHNANLALHDTLEALQDRANFRWDFKFYDNEDHGSVVIPAEFDAYRFLFKGYQMPVKTLMKQPELLAAHFTQISERLGYQVVPDEALIDEMANVCMRQDLYAQAEALLLKNSENYPNSAHAQSRYQNFKH
ncbi:alpha/beta hydrolase [Formosa sediminum]|uniref:Alpha/beta hydrolase n=1 Tax=Formosa sediminum TaxID=2594004 RepID=A0A516GSF9_9FLAO|nr:alpha/beta hydrolase-fold protein [Formosa sediminum]QDO94454.1 alpha/beta hydrolase [Formosa sediminum]